MTVVYPFYPGDQDLALKNTIWMGDLGGYNGHQVVVCYDPRCTAAVVEEIGAQLIAVFDKVWRLPAKMEMDGWPQGANYFFRFSATWLATHPEWPYFFWMEPDAIPLTPGWLDALEAEYKRTGKPFMGERVDVQKEKPEVPVHMSGVGIYCNPIYEKAGEAYRAFDTAWDIAAKDQIVPQAHWTKLIQHYWKHGTFTSAGDMAKIRPETVIFHSSKDGSLIDLLRQKAAPEKESHSVGTEPTSGTPSREEIGTPSAQPPVKELPNGFWVLADDSIISGLVETTGRLDHDLLIPKILEHIREGDTVVDVGAFIGDHTIAYSKAVGSKGVVHAFEPNPFAYKCLQHNMKTCGNVILHNVGLSDSMAYVSLNCDDGNYGSAYIGHGKRIADIMVDALDTNIPWKVNFIKIDVEGYELKVLRGAGNLINRCAPRMVIEINPVALARQGITPEDIFGWLKEHHYDHSIIIDYRPDHNWYDIFCIPERQPSGTTQDVNSQFTPAPVAATFDYKEVIQEMKQFAAQSTSNRLKVMQNLRHAGLTPQQHHKKRK
jgi:FkbM family methyltransferase